LRTGWINAVAHLESLIDLIRGFHSYSGKHLALRYQEIFALSPLSVLGDILTLKDCALTLPEALMRGILGIGRLVMLGLPILIPQS
jgi:hypothetical protein